jgi:hypothetical protein
LLRSLQEIQSDFEEEAKASAGLWSQGKKNVGIALGYGLEDRGSRVRFPAGAGNLSA